MKPYEKEMRRVSNKVENFLKRTFNNIYLNGPQLPADTLDKDPTMVVCTHRSQLDYFILGWHLHQMGVPNIRFAAGENLTDLPVIGKKFQGFGAFPIRRAKRLGKNYLRDLCNQVVTMLNDGDNIIVFPEGGRSYKGNMMEVRGGIIGAQVLAQAQSPERNYVFFPFAISYEQLPELPYFSMLERGKSLKSKKGLLNGLFGDLLYFGADALAYAKLLVVNRIGVRYSNVYIDYDKPVAVNDLVDLKANFLPKARDAFSANRVSMQKVGTAIYQKFLRLYRLLPSHILAAHLQQHPVSTLQECREAVRPIVENVREQQRNCLSIDKLSDAELVDKGIEQLRKMKSITVHRGTAEVSRPGIVAYYSASIEK
ncbi:MAG: 1-acyl-sn-glycerol-3-phosphate acyltransferase [Chitinivibrionales bacterium]